jgi:putative intracellular protease/amidase
VTAALCHGIAALLDCRLSDGSYLIEGKTMTGFANVEEAFVDEYVGRKVMPWHIEDAAKERGANYIPSVIRRRRLRSRRSRRNRRRRARACSPPPASTPAC